GTTTSARMVRFTEPLGRRYGVRAICGKGGFPDEAVEPMHELGMVYFAIVGGAAALETTQIEEIEDVVWEELMPECLWKFRLKVSARSPSASTHTATRCTARCRTVPKRSWRSSLPDFDLNLGRHVGLTHVIDKGLGPRAWEDILDVAGDHISIV